MARNRITISVQGDPKDDGHVRLNDFLAQLDSIRQALRHTQTLIQSEERERIYYRIVKVTYSSPLTLTVEAATEKPSEMPDKVIGKFLGSIQQIKTRSTIPKDFDYQTAEAYRDIVNPQHKHISSLVIKNTRKRFAIDKKYEENITKAIGPDEFVEGSITGTLDTVKLHNTTTFEVFPTIGPRRVVCHFPPELKEQVKQALERYVTVYGMLRYKHWDKFPHAIDARELEVLPLEDELPTLSELRGTVPDLTGGLDTGDFLRKVRDGWPA